MTLVKNIIVSFLILSFITGCSASRHAIISGDSELTDAQVCRNYLNDKDILAKGYIAEDTDEANYIYALNKEVKYRALTEYKCEIFAAQDRKKIAQGVVAAVVAVGVVVLAVAAAEAGGSNNYSSGYAWDQFYDGNYNLVWRCRDKSTGQFAYNSACSGQYQNDNTWTGK